MLGSVYALTTLSLFVCTIITVQSEVTCYDDWLVSEESSTCLKQMDENLDWYAARTTCQNTGGDLVKIISQEMNDLLTDAYGSTTSYAWIGINDIANEGTWVWLDETTEPAWTNWLDEQPDGLMEQNCAVISFLEDSQWRDITCGSTSGRVLYICELPPVVTYPVTCPDGWVESPESGTCLRFYTDGENWSNARIKCQEENGDLVKIVSLGMDKLIAGTFGYSNPSNAWIGFNDIVTEDWWVWLDEDEKPAYINWGNSQPSWGTKQDCGYMSFPDDYWGDTDCDVENAANLGYLCEIPSIGDTPGTEAPTMVTSKTTALFQNDITTTADSRDIMPTSPELNVATTERTQPRSGANTDGPVISLTTPDDSDAESGAASTTGGLGAGAVAGIVISCLVLAMVVALLGFGIHKRRQNVGRRMDSVKFVNDSEGNLRMK